MVLVAHLMKMRRDSSDPIRLVTDVRDGGFGGLSGKYATKARSRTADSTNSKNAKGNISVPALAT